MKKFTLRHWLAIASILASSAISTTEADDLPFSERFRNNRNDWTLGSGDDWGARIEGGVLRFRNEDDRFRYAHVKIDHDTERDIQLAFDAKHISGSKTATFGMNAFATTDWDERVTFMASEIGTIHVGTERDGAWHLHQPKLAVEAYRKGEANRWTYKRIGDRGYVFLNDQIVLIYPDDGWRRGELFQIGIAAGLAVEFDNFEVEYLDESEEKVAAYYEAYETFKRDQGIVPLAEEFEDASPVWIPEEEPETWFVEIDEGELVVENLNLDKTRLVRWLAPVSIDPFRDYELSTRLRYLDGTDNNFIGLDWGNAWGENGRKGLNRFGISSNGQYTIGRSHEGKWETLRNWTQSEHVKQGEAWNELVVRKIGERAYYFVNGNIVANLPAPEWYGYRMGWDVCYDVSVAFDYFRAQYLDLPPEKSGQLAARYESELRAQRIAAAGPLEPFEDDFEGDSAKNWKFMASSDWQEIQIENGSLYWKSHHPEKVGLLIPRKDYAINGVADFRIDLRVRNNGSTSNRAIEFKWGDAENWVSFGITFSQHFRYLSGIDPEQKIPFTKTNAIKPDGWNLLSMRKIDDSLYLLINDDLVAARRAEESCSSTFSLLNQFGVNVEIDKVALTYPQLDDKERMAEKEQYHEYIVENRLKYRRDGTWTEPPFMVKARLKDAFNEDKKIQRAFERFKKRYRNKTLAHIIADKGQPREKRGARHYFYLGNVGQMGWFVEVHAINLPGKPRNNDPRNYAIHDSMDVVSSYELYDQ